MRAILLLFALLTAACSAAPEAPDAIADTSALLDYLGDRGYVTEPIGLNDRGRPLAPSTSYRFPDVADESTMQVYEFVSASEADDGLTTLRSELRGQLGLQVYADGGLIVLYRGNNASIRQALSQALGTARGI